MSSDIIKLGLPKGRMEKGVLELLAAAGIRVTMSSRAYRPSISLEDFETKILKPQDIVEMLHIGSRDLGFAGADWVEEMQVELVELLDTGMDPVKLVAAAPKSLLVEGKLPKQKLVVASEYERLTRKWIADRKIDASFVRSHGATEVFPPEDADCIVDNTSTGSTLRANNLEILDTIMTSSTRLYASPEAMKNPIKRAGIEKFTMLAKSVVDARQRVMIEVNVSANELEKVIKILPSMRKPTISELHGSAGYVVKAAVPRSELTSIIPAIKSAGGTDVVVSLISQLVA